MKADDAPLDKVTLWRVRFEKMCLCAILFTVHQQQPGIKPISLARRLHHADTHLRTYTHKHFPTVQQVWEVGNGWCDLPILPIFAQIIILYRSVLWWAEVVGRRMTRWRYWSDNKEDQAVEGQLAEGERCPLVTTERSRNFDQETSSGGALWHFI